MSYEHAAIQDLAWSLTVEINRFEAEPSETRGELAHLRLSDTRVALLAQLYALMVPSWLFYSILAGWILYLVVAIAAATGLEKTYPAALVLSIVSLAASLPQPEHYSLAETGQTLASLTFIAGSVLQIGVIILVTSSMLLERHQSVVKSASIQ